MFTINNTIIVTLLASVVSVYATHSFEAADVGANQEIELEQLESMTNQLGETQYTFKCILGNGKTSIS